MRRQPGFTLVEVLVVGAIIALLAVAAFPGFLQARMNVAESTAISTLRTYSTCLEQYRAAQTPPTYPPDLATLGAQDPPYVTTALAADPATRQGYVFSYTVDGADEYTVTATPQTPGTTGRRTFAVDESGVITADEGQPLG